MLRGLIIALGLAASAAPAQGTLVQPPVLTNETLIQHAFAMCGLHKEQGSLTQFHANLAAAGYNKVGEIRGLATLDSFETDEGLMGAVKVTALKGKPGLFDCMVSSTGPHAGLEEQLDTTIEANFAPMRSMMGLRIFRIPHVEVAAEIRRRAELGTTMIVFTMGGVYE